MARTYPVACSGVRQRNFDFVQEVFYAAQNKGDIPPDESWLWFSVVGYDPFIYFRVYIQNAHDKGLCCSDRTEYISGSCNDGKSYATLSVLKIKNNEYIESFVECSAINFFAVPPRAISREITEYNVAKCPLRNNVSIFLHYT